MVVLGVILPLGIDQSGNLIFTGHSYRMLKAIAGSMRADLKLIKSEHVVGVVMGVPTE